MILLCLPHCKGTGCEGNYSCERHEKDPEARSCMDDVTHRPLSKSGCLSLVPCSACPLDLMMLSIALPHFQYSIVHELEICTELMEAELLKVIYFRTETISPVFEC